MERDEAFRGPVQKNKNLWEEITAALLAEGYHVSRNQVENKWKNLNKRWYILEQIFDALNYMLPAP